MKHSWRKALASFLVLALTVVPLLSCGDGDDNGEKEVTILLGEVTDLTGPGSPAVTTLHYALQDVARYYNEKDLIPGVTLDTVSWDTKFDPAREVPGYDWVRERGADVIVSVIPQTGVILKPFADRDKVPIVAMSTHSDTLEPPGWVFSFSQPNDWEMTTLMKWINENHWDYAQGIPKIGLVGWSEAQTLTIETAMRKYVQDHPDHFEWLGAHLAPVGTMLWNREVEEMKDADYVDAHAFMQGSFMKEYQGRGYSATFIDVGTACSYRAFLADMLGWEALDGILSANCSLMWNESTPLVDLANELVRKYRPGEAQEIIDAGLAYVGAVQQFVSIFQILINAVEAVGAENFDGQAFYDAAVQFKTGGPMYEGHPEWSFSETKRYLVDDMVIYEFDAAVEDVVLIADWMPMITG